MKVHTNISLIFITVISRSWQVFSIIKNGHNSGFSCSNESDQMWISVVEEYNLRTVFLQLHCLWFSGFLMRNSCAWRIFTWVDSLFPSSSGPTCRISGKNWKTPSEMSRKCSTLTKLHCGSLSHIYTCDRIQSTEENSLQIKHYY